MKIGARIGMCLGLLMVFNVGKTNEQANIIEQLQALKAQQEALNKKIATLEAAIAKIQKSDTSIEATVIGNQNDAVSNEHKRSSETEAPSNSESSIVAKLEALDPSVFGDARIRYEYNSPLPGESARERGVIRGRLGATITPFNQLTIGARLVGGDRDDPNTSDITLGSFDDDLDLGIDQLYGQYALGPTSLFFGKFPQIFSGTDMIWDGDIPLQGLGGQYRQAINTDWHIYLNATHFLIDENARGSDSSMNGLQIGAEYNSENLSLISHLSRYNYALTFLDSADEGDFRTNALKPDGSYLSNFDVIDVYMDVAYTSMEYFNQAGLRLHLVKNIDANIQGDSGWRVELYLGQIDNTQAWSLLYSVSALEQDAVLAAFSNDNIPIATNYKNHSLVFQWILAPSLLFDFTAYRFKVLDAMPGMPLINYENRLRLNLSYSF
ncbi:putative porin [Alteromonas oceanisediminis]|uniref:putative porin n=1 Tax=Alteromonas oceanisediminis TaxID=2836180 RepID=UPI001BDA8170|nr:putative porin [Alteromonas oceanisediminis]MBT0585179.1 putative porin [Alteromonas oceanisediminis]